MTRTHHPLRILLLTTALGVSGLTFSPATFAREHTGSFSTVVNPKIPSQMTFCGDRVDLDRMDMFERFDRELTQMCYSHGNTLLTIKRANRYFPILAPILKAKGVPEDMLYMACIESTLNPTAVSGAKAAGLWQFMPATAKEYGLEVNDYVDERFHPEKSTEAACRYLLSALAKYGNWESVAASYNGGMGRVSRELSAQQAESAYDLWLNSETSRYMFRLLAMKAIMEHPAHFGYILEADQLYRPVEYTEVTVSDPVEDWAQWAVDHGTTYMTLRDHNPWIRAKSLPNKTGKSYIVKIPTEESMKRSTAPQHIYNKQWINR
ncbi:MAG: lytic transglycosylase domain-containing protein [Barnesiella sp.]|nr:lytic transglycosylase domain-containing protein [Barnesiella sp.]